MRTQDETIQCTREKLFITIVDATKFFFQWRIHPQDRNKITVISHRGQESLDVALMGFIKSAPYVQRQMENILRKHRQYCVVYIADMVITQFQPCVEMRRWPANITALSPLYQALTTITKQ